MSKLSRVGFNMTPEVLKEVERIIEISDLVSKADVFRKAFSLLRIHINAAAKGQEICRMDPKEPDYRYIIMLPFDVKREEQK